MTLHENYFIKLNLIALIYFCLSESLFKEIYRNAFNNLFKALSILKLNQSLLWKYNWNSNKKEKDQQNFLFPEETTC